MVMKEATLSECAICGTKTSGKASCDTCGTILVDGKVPCKACGTMLPSFSVSCNHCGRKRGEVDEDFTPEMSEVIKHFLMIPGMTKEMAIELYKEGLKDFASLIAKSMTQSQRNKGLHKVIARRIMLMDVAEGDDAVDVTEKLECPICKTLVDLYDEKCGVCGHTTTIRTLNEDDPKTGGVYRKILTDPAFREMPVEFQEELSEVFSEEDEEEPSEEEDDSEWDEIDSDLEELEKATVEEEVEETPQAPETILVCPLCNTEVVSDAQFCHGCGARFEQA